MDCSSSLFKVDEDALREKKAADLGYIQENYKALQQIFLEEKEQEMEEEQETSAVSVPLVAKTQK